MDLEIAYDHSINDQRKILDRLNADLKRIGLPITIFTTSEAATEFKDEIRRLKSAGHNICCHGYDHGITENYRTMDQCSINEFIKISTNNIENIIQDKVDSFRGPGFSTSSETQNILLKYGYNSDYSVCSQRLDFMNSIGGNFKWLNSPRMPYHPSEHDPYKKGSSPLWVIPLSSIGLPFISGSLYLFGLSFMRKFYILLLKEAIRVGKPIVYLFHSYEFCRYTGNHLGNEITKGSNRTPQKLIHKFYGSDINKKYEDNHNLMKYLISFKNTKLFTSVNYSKHLENFENENTLL